MDVYSQKAKIAYNLINAFCKVYIRIMLQFQNVGLRYPTGPEILADLNFSLEPHSFHFLTGNSGAGKTSLLKLMYLAHGPTRGTMNVFGQNIKKLNKQQLPRLRRRIGVVYQDFRLLPHLTVFDNVALPLRLAGEKDSKIRSHVTELLDWVGLGAHHQHLPSTLSGGEQQRVAIARAVIGHPDLLLADEPTGNVDEAMAAKILRLFEHLHRQGTAVVLATHSDQLTQRFAYPRLHLQEGKIHKVTQS